MTKKRCVSILVLGFLLAWSAGAQAEALPPILNVGTHPMGSFFNVVGSAVATVVGKNTPMRATVKPMAGPGAWFPLLESKEIDLGVLNSWDAEKGYLGESIYTKLSAGKGFPERLIAISVNNAIGMLVAADSGIQNCADLRRKKVAGNHPTPSLNLQVEALLANCGLKWSEIVPIPVSSTTEGAKAVIDGRADSCMATIGTPTTDELHSKRGARILGVDPAAEAVKRTREKFPGYPVKVSPGPGRTGVEKEQHLWAYDIYLVGRQDLPEEAVYLVVKALWEKHKDMAPMHVLLRGWTPDRFVTKEALIPFHPGAVKFYREKGVWTGEMAKLQEALLAKKK